MMDYTLDFNLAKQSSKHIHTLSAETVNLVLQQLAKQLSAGTAHILEANELDLDRMDPKDPKYDRLVLSEERILAIAADVNRVAALASPLGEVLERNIMPNGLDISKVRVPLGVVGVIYEARPNVTVDVFALCFKTGNVAVLKGGTDADQTNRVLVGLIRDVLRSFELDEHLITLLPAERAATEALLNATAYVDVIIPRGSQGLINYIREHSRVPVIETGAGIVHTFFDVSADLQMGKSIIMNAKTRRVSVCNALDCLILHQERLNDIAELVGDLAASQVRLYADAESFAQLSGKYPADLLHRASAEDFGTEFLDYKMAIKTVLDLDAALEHIAQFSSRHSEAIISENEENQLLFLNAVDAAAVFVNASTAFTDGGQFGMGAEIGISTQKLHARGPMGLSELTSYKWIVRGSGQTRSA